MNDIPYGFVLSESAIYAYNCQDHFKDIVSFAAAIPEHLRSIFLIPIQVQYNTASDIAYRVARSTFADGITPTGDTEEAGLFGTKTFTYDDNEPTVPSSEPGSIFEQVNPDSLTRHQEYDFDENIQAPSDTSYMSDIDITQYISYPYRTEEYPVRHSSVRQPSVVMIRLALKPDDLESRAPKEVRDRAKVCSVNFISFDEKTHVYTFKVNCGNVNRTVQATLSDVDEVAMSCDCPFWRWNGPEFHAKHNSFMLGQPFGTASTPNIRDPDRKYYLCKHAYAVLRRLDTFVQEVIDENWDKKGEELLEEINDNWDRLEGVSQVPLAEIDEDDIDIDWEDPKPEDKLEPELIDDESIDVDLSELEDEDEDEFIDIDLSELEDYEEPEEDIGDNSEEPEEDVDDNSEEPEDYEVEELDESEFDYDYEVPEEPKKK